MQKNLKPRPQPEKKSSVKKKATAKKPSAPKKPTISAKKKKELIELVEAGKSMPAERHAAKLIGSAEAAKFVYKLQFG
ncbi:MAG: hypothetical protein OEL75_03525 [Kiritimatiellaceae bacterium]|nr:hypothetical protein [Kiritimatiellaceae bacterium]